MIASVSAKQQQIWGGEWSGASRGALPQRKACVRRSVVDKKHRMYKTSKRSSESLRESAAAAFQDPYLW